ncbi:MAG TPA: aminodeoxychorismate synthase component I, partial [Solirubrobacteraceae bacterium]|nr:aminodeoxychorismate synthase component I [Solirubrobacteraceae bacterium]
GSGLFAGIPQDFSVVRYHSLAVTGPIGPEGRVTAWTDDGVVMGIEHTRRPIWGVQFHPESVSTEHGRKLIENFYELARVNKPARPFGLRRLVTPAQRGAESPGPPTSRRLHIRTIEGVPAGERVFERLFATADHAFWLDSADAPTRLAQCSYLGASLGAGSRLLEYDVERASVTVHRPQGTVVEQCSIFDVLERQLAEDHIDPPAGVARGLVGGFVGYLGYECKADCGSPNLHRSDLPDAMMLLANRVVAIDHVAKLTHLLALEPGACEPEAPPPGSPPPAGGEATEDDASAQLWLDEAETVVREVLGTPALEHPLRIAAAEEPSDAPPEPVRFRCGRGRRQYLADIAKAQAALAAGESYEVCLTDQISTSASPPPFELYRALRRSNPAPFAAYLKLGEIAIASSSPERFLSIDRQRRVQARPIKGTAPRCEDPARDEAVLDELLRDEKTFAEHLMIVDLLRNDLGRVCEVDSVRVSEFMAGERYRTVHQLVSTIIGVLAAGRTPVDCVRACFPGGSMTGAPKLRTMEIIDDIEREARGVYSGAIGYFGLDGSVDLSIVIRTIVMRPGRTTIGAGGAIVMQSDPAEEFDEFLLKARAPMAAIALAATGDASAEAWTVERDPAPAPAATP